MFGEVISLSDKLTLLPEITTEPNDVMWFVKFVMFKLCNVVDDTVVASTAKFVLDEVAVIVYPFPSRVTLFAVILKQVPLLVTLFCNR